MVSDQFSGTTEATWSQGLAVRATIFVTRRAFHLILKIKEGLLTDRLDSDWSGLVLTGIFQHTEHKDQSDQDHDGHDRISVSTIEVKHL